MDIKTETQMWFVAWLMLQDQLKSEMVKDYMKNNPLGDVTGGENETE